MIGLLREDLYMEEDPVVSEAIRRLPENEKNLRNYRIKRALDLSMKHAELPRDMWTTPEQVYVIYIYIDIYSMLIGAIYKI